VLRHQGDEGLHDHIWLLLHHVIEDFLAVLVDEALQEIECLLIYPVTRALRPTSRIAALPWPPGATVPINDSLLEALKEAKQAACSPYVIEWGGKRVASIKKGVAAAAQRAGVKCSPHVLRHTAAVWMAEGGVPMEEIAQYLGHEDARTTYRIYARFSPTHLREAAALLEV
jgi:hypothetical protein